MYIHHKPEFSYKTVKVFSYNLECMLVYWKIENKYILNLKIYLIK